MSKHTSFKTGGNADFFIKPTNVEEIQYLIELSSRSEEDRLRAISELSLMDMEELVTAQIASYVDEHLEDFAQIVP